MYDHSIIHDHHQPANSSSQCNTLRFNLLEKFRLLQVGQNFSEFACFYTYFLCFLSTIYNFNRNVYRASQWKAHKNPLFFKQIYVSSMHVYLHDMIYY